MNIETDRLEMKPTSKHIYIYISFFLFANLHDLDRFKLLIVLHHHISFVIEKPIKKIMEKHQRYKFNLIVNIFSTLRKLYNL